MFSVRFERFRPVVGLVLLAALLVGAATIAAEQDSNTLVLVVMDPLALPLSCDCVKGYAQRDYEQLGRHLSKSIQRPVKVEFFESLTQAKKELKDKPIDMVIGKQSVVRFEAEANQLGLREVAALTGKDGNTFQSGLFLVAASDPALTVADLGSHQIFFGPRACDEKHSAALQLLKVSGLPGIKEPETCSACSDGATKVLELHAAGQHAATVISSYAQPLLEGCGTIKKGDLRIVGETNPVPFIRAFVNDKLPNVDQRTIESTLLGVNQHPKLCAALESKLGFIPIETAKKK